MGHFTILPLSLVLIPVLLFFVHSNINSEKKNTILTYFIP